MESVDIRLAAHLAEGHVRRHSRDDQPHHHRRGHGADPRLHRHADHGRAAAPALRPAAGDQGLARRFLSGYFPESARGCTYLVDWAVRPAL